MPKGIITDEATRERARKLRAQGLYYREIGAQLGVSLKTVHEWCTDSKRTKARARQARYQGTCDLCGGSTTGQRGPGKAPSLCIACWLEAWRVPKWAQRAKRRAYQREKYGGEYARRRAQKAKQKPDYALKARAHHAVHRALERGELIRPTGCEACGKGDQLVIGARRAYIEAHHDDYSRPLDVRWLCGVCHKRHHAEKKAAA